MKSEKFIFVNGARGFEILRPFILERDVRLLKVLDENEDFKYMVKEVLIPDWMNSQEYSNNYIKYLYSVECGYKEEMGEEAYRQFCEYRTASRIAIYELLSVKSFRSEFRKKMRVTVDSWLSLKRHERRFPAPLSPNQFQWLLNDRINKIAIELDRSWKYRHNYNIRGATK